MPPAKRTGNRLPRDAYSLILRQSPEVGRAMTTLKEKDRKPVDPPPIVQLQISDYSDLARPYFSCIVSLWDKTEDKPAEEPLLHGSLVSSLHRLKDLDSHDGGFFIFSDLSVKTEGEYRLKFVLWELLDGEIESLQSILSPPFKVHQPKVFPGLAESTFLTRAFSDQGVRLRIRKETRTAIKRSAAEAEAAYSSHVEPAGMTSPYAPPTSHAYSYPIDYSMVKRQKPTGGDGWAYSQPQASPGLYAHQQTSQVSGYYAEPAAGAQQTDYAFRSASSADNSMAQSYYPRAPMNDYNQTSPAIPYPPNPRSAQSDVNGSVATYSDSSHYESSVASPMDNRSHTDPSQSQALQYGVSGQHAVLPPIASAAGAGQVMTAPSGYPQYRSTDNRYSNVAQPAARSTYGQAYPQMHANYT